MITLNLMVQYYNPTLDATFAALADATRRGVLEHLARADSSITELAEMFQMTLTGMKKHVSVLENAELVITEKIGRVRRCRLGHRALVEEQRWLGGYHERWVNRFNELDKIVEELKQGETLNVQE